MSAGDFVRAYLQRVVNERDLTAVDELVAADYRGSGYGWPADLGALREFYREQSRTRPDWHIDVQETVEVGECVVVRALAGGTVPVSRSVEWLARYVLEGGRIVEIDILALREREESDTTA